MEFVARTIRDDGNKASCIIHLPADYITISKSGNDKYDDLVELQIIDKIYFEGLSFVCEEIIPVKEVF